MPEPSKTGSLADGEMKVVPVTLDTIRKVSPVKVYCPPDLKSQDARNGMLKTIEEVKKRFAGKGLINDDCIPIMDPVNDMGVDDPQLKIYLDKIEKFESHLAEHPLHESKNVQKIIDNCRAKAEAEAKHDEAKRSLNQAFKVIKFDELRCRKKILRRLGYANEQDVIQMKGRVACEISTADELLLTELLFSNVFNDLSIPETNALLSCFICERAPKDDEAPRLRGKLEEIVKLMQTEARKIARI